MVDSFFHGFQLSISVDHGQHLSDGGVLGSSTLREVHTHFNEGGLGIYLGGAAGATGGEIIIFLIFLFFTTTGREEGRTHHPLAAGEVAGAGTLLGNNNCGLFYAEFAISHGAHAGKQVGSGHIDQAQLINHRRLHGLGNRSGSGSGFLLFLFFLLTFFFLFFLFFIIRGYGNWSRFNGAGFLENEVHQHAIIHGLLTQNIESIFHEDTLPIHAVELQVHEVVAITKHTFRGGNRLSTCGLNSRLHLGQLFFPHGINLCKSLGTERIVSSLVVVHAAHADAFLTAAGSSIVRVNLDYTIELIVSGIIVTQVKVTIGKSKEAIYFLHVLDVFGSQRRIIAHRVTHEGKLVTGTLIVGVALQHVKQELLSLIVAAYTGIFHGNGDGGIANTLDKEFLQLLGGRGLGNNFPCSFVLLESLHILFLGVAGATLLEQFESLGGLSLATGSLTCIDAVLRVTRIHGGGAHLTGAGSGRSADVACRAGLRNGAGNSDGSKNHRAL